MVVHLLKSTLYPQTCCLWAMDSFLCQSFFLHVWAPSLALVKPPSPTYWYVVSILLPLKWDGINVTFSYSMCYIQYTISQLHKRARISGRKKGFSFSSISGIEIIVYIYALWFTLLFTSPLLFHILLWHTQCAQVAVFGITFLSMCWPVCFLSSLAIMLRGWMTVQP